MARGPGFCTGAMGVGRNLPQSCPHDPLRGKASGEHPQGSQLLPASAGWIQLLCTSDPTSHTAGPGYSWLPVAPVPPGTDGASPGNAFQPAWCRTQPRRGCIRCQGPVALLEVALCQPLPSLGGGRYLPVESGFI